MLQAILRINPAILATSFALLLFALYLVVRRRLQLTRQRRRRLDDQMQDMAGETSVLPLAHLASSVEVLDLDDLLAGEDAPAAAAARRELEAPTDVMADPDSFFPLPRLTGETGRPADAAAARAGAAVTSAAASAAARATAPVAAPTPQRPAAAAAPARSEPPSSAAPPVRELALAWFEARGYRPSTASQAVRPIELVLRHRNDPTRAYAFISERERLTADRIDKLIEHANSIGLTKVLIAAETAVGSELQRRFRRAGVRLVDNDEMRREFDKVGLRVAAKIIAVARNRARLAKVKR